MRRLKDHASGFKAPVPGDHDTGRKDWVDGLRALAMLFVIIGHQLQGHHNYFLFTSPIKLPLFFAVTGYVFHYHRSGIRSFAAGTFRRLAVPWLIAVFAEILLMIPFRGLGSVPGAVRAAVTEVTLWYLPCLFFAEIFHYITLRLCKTTAAVIVASLAESLIGYCLARHHIMDAMKINTALIAQACLLVGFLIKRSEHRLSALRWPAVLCSVLAYVILGLISMKVWPGKGLDVHTNRYDCYPYPFVMIYVGCFALFLLFARIRHMPRGLSFIGRNTLFYYMSHNYVIAGIRRCFSAVRLDLPLLPRVVLTTVLACLICGLLSCLVNRFFPELVGRRRRKRAA